LKLALAIGSAALVLLGGCSLLIGALGWADPAAFQLADDLDPFGEPPSGFFFAGAALLSTALLAGGVFGLWRSVRRRSTTTFVEPTP
jgi:hypothetical protein